MSVRKTLTSIVLAGALTLGGTGCESDSPEYLFNGRIGEDQVKFYENGLNDNFLEVVRADGSKVKYFDENNDYKLDFVQITVGENTTEYKASSKNPVVIGIVEKAQKQFDTYLTRITEIQTAPLNRE